MNLVIQNIIDRRTTKPTAMSGEQVPDDIVIQCLEAAHWAPNHGRTEPWRFFVYTNNGLKDFCVDHANLYKQNTLPEAFQETKFLSLQAMHQYVSHAVLVVMKRTPNTKIPKLEEYAAVASATQNLLLAAQSFGIASIWSTGGMVLHQAMKDYLNLDAEDEVLGCIYLGVAKGDATVGVRKSTVMEQTIWKR